MKFLMAILLTTSFGCSTLDQSIRLGGTIGTLAGGLGTYAVQSSSGTTAPPENVGVGASVGLALGLVIAYFTHQGIAKERDQMILKNRVDHGDLPPTPFIFPNTKGR
jgi:hypothetical protein